MEIGCGTGKSLEWLKTLYPCEWRGGVEICAAAAEQARDKLDAVFVGNIEEIELPIEDESLDLILCLDVLEHLVDPWRVLTRLGAYLKPGGALIASIPNVRNRKVLLPLLFKSKWEYAEAGILDRTHLRFFVRDSAIRLIESAGLKVDMVHATGLGRSRRSRVVNALLPGWLRSFFEYQYLIRGIKYGG